MLLNFAYIKEILIIFAFYLLSSIIVSTPFVRMKLKKKKKKNLKNVNKFRIK